MEALVRFLVQVSVLIAVLEIVNAATGSVKVYYTHPARNSSLMCYECYNGDHTNDCIKMSNASNIPVLHCRHGQKFCKVRRFHTNDKLTTFGRYCADQCAPGCAHGVIYEECISCCTTSLCNTGNGTSGKLTASGFLWVIFPFWIWLRRMSG